MSIFDAKQMFQDLRRGREVLFILVPASDPDHEAKRAALVELVNSLTGEPGTFTVRVKPAPENSI